ncbi:phosphatidylserine decarboxylase [Streptomyces mobaraensis]|uniref:Phosphatidylserine decarboxylase n=1 Tax=Streptomyces verticillus TaxID=29309 RepID=Q9FB29_9ACTN|nr:phosphatidylserine decarboxylase [Streptomyces verticillus]
MAQDLNDWIEDEVVPYEEKPLEWISQYHFFRDPARAAYVDHTYFFSPADGAIVYQKVVDPQESIIDIKGKPYSLAAALRDESFGHRCLVIGIFMTFFDVHINRMPYGGRLSFALKEPIGTFNLPMLAMEQDLLERLRVNPAHARYLHLNERMVNRVDAPRLRGPYWMLQIADYDVDSITPFCRRQGMFRSQGRRFSQIRYGSQVDLVIPMAADREYVPVEAVGRHVKAGLDPLVKIRWR